MCNLYASLCNIITLKTIDWLLHSFTYAGNKDLVEKLQFIIKSKTITMISYDYYSNV